MTSHNSRRSKAMIWQLTLDRRHYRRQLQVYMTAAVLLSLPAMVTRHRSRCTEALLLAGMVCALRMSWSASCSMRVSTTLCDAEDVNAIGPLLEIRMLDCGSLRAEVERALARLLPRVSADQVCLLTEAQHRGLCSTLRSKNSPLVEAGVRALTIVGRPSALPAVQRLARQSQRMQENPSLSQAAMHCLEALRLRKEAEQEQSTLLREAQVSGSVAGTLLRPVEDIENSPDGTQQENRHL